jgi:hypothetical protein
VLVARHRGDGDGSSGAGEGPFFEGPFFSRPPRGATLATTMRAATTLPEPPRRGTKTRVKAIGLPARVASGARASQSANTNRENRRVVRRTRVGVL